MLYHQLYRSYSHSPIVIRTTKYDMIFCMCLHLACIAKIFLCVECWSVWLYSTQLCMNMNILMKIVALVDWQLRRDKIWNGCLIACIATSEVKLIWIIVSHFFIGRSQSKKQQNKFNLCCPCVQNKKARRSMRVKG